MCTTGEAAVGGGGGVRINVGGESYVCVLGEAIRRMGRGCRGGGEGASVLGVGVCSAPLLAICCVCTVPVYC